MRDLELIAKRIFKSVECDLESRRGFCDLWETLDISVRLEIWRENIGYIKRILEEELAVRKVEDK